ncbi:MAG: DUF2147 domain-containing protein [Bacteroidetes bacterium]|nr:DUF2147 domain-containing protein [Bacteroidota bacterium]
MKTITCFVAMICMVFSHAIAQQHNTPDALVGTWLVEDGSAKVKIEKMNGTYSGRMVWIKNPNDKSGKPLVDSNNPEPSLRSRPQLGLALLENFKYDEVNHWSGGTIYDPDGGKTYSCKITMKDNQTLEVRGYVGISLFGRTDTWKRSQDITMK